ncbi:MAG: hypothetical protein WDM90_20510 [Ferruginibacter sp.]
MNKQLKKVQYVEEVLSIPAAITLLKDTATQKLVPAKIFSDSVIQQGMLDSGLKRFLRT